VTVVVDTSILIDHLRGDARAHRLLDGAFSGGERVTASVVTKVEVLAGMHQEEEAATRRLLSILEWVPVDDGLAEAAGELARQHLRSHSGVDPVDFIIAATVDLLGAKLWTRNRKHFPMFPDLPAVYE
jgi:predicted nucleic acid-binding protein